MIRTVVVALVVAGLLTACGESAPPATSTPPGATEPAQETKQHVLELEVTGTATITTLTFTLDGKASEEKNVTLPWRKRIEIPYGTGRHEYNLAMQRGAGKVFATATVDGKLVTQTGGNSSGGGTATSNLSGSFED
ncbi:hypothetical protein DMH04_45775 [Kibdelosporangium aridum]|uniref:Uncharacterized protein n=1 Tax=Kibdelosporangium aridum TaxID=2030 RepID=A0A428YN52_KIBAR|nr:hypothetical protein [Kibdelosporangium aridum]RSM69635.1 hypothetical protein DMH04_45775 [Kibdelosporangium aridum]